MAQKSLADLLEPLKSATEDGRIRWKKDRIGFICSVDDATVEVWDGRNDDDGSSFISIRLLNADGDVVDLVSADDFQSLYGRLEKLFQAARRSAYKVDQIIDKLSKKLTKTE